MARRNGFLDGIQAFNAAYDTVNNVARDFELGRVMSQKPESVDNYAAPEGYTNVQDAMANFKEGDSVVAPGLAPRRQTTFMGKNYDGDLAPEKVNGMRYRAAADVVGKYDPIKGMGMQREIMRDERDAQRFGWEAQAQPLKQRTAELQVKGLERTDTTEENKVRLAEEERALVDNLRTTHANKDKDPQAMEQWQKLVGPYVNAMHTFNGDQNNYGIAKDGSIVGIPKSGGAAFTVDPIAALPMVLQINRVSSKFGGDPMAAAKALNDMTDAERKKFLEADDRAYARAVTGAKLVGDKEQRDNTSRYQMGSLANQVEGLRLRRDALNTDKTRADRADWQLIGPSEDGKGLVQFNKRTGGMQLMPLPQGANAADVWKRISGAGGEQRPVKVSDEGEKFLVGGQLRISDGRGGYIREDGVLPSAQDAALKKAGVPDNLRGQLRFTPDGTEVVTPGGVAYGLNEIPQLVADLERLTANTAKVEELQKPQPRGLSRGQLAATSPWRLDNMLEGVDPTLGSPKITFPYQGR